MTITLIAMYSIIIGFTVRDACERLRASKLLCLIFGALWPIYWLTYITDK